MNKDINKDKNKDKNKFASSDGGNRSDNSDTKNEKNNKNKNKNVKNNKGGNINKNGPSKKGSQGKASGAAGSGSQGKASGAAGSGSQGKSAKPSQEGSSKEVQKTSQYKNKTKSKNKSGKLRIIPLGGLDGIGKNMTAFEYGNDMILVDAGLMFPDDDYPGVDLLVPDYTYVLEKEYKLRGIVITHGHEDHTGALPYLLKDLSKKTQIYGTRLTLGLIEGKLDEHRFHDVILQEIKPGQTQNIGAFSCSFFSVNHSIPGSLGVFIQTPAGNILHTGDFKLDQTPIDGITTDFAAIAKYSQVGIDLLMSDSTNANISEFTQSEAEVGKVLEEIIHHAKHRVIVAAFASHVHRIQQVCNAAVKSGRNVIVTGRSMLTNTAIAQQLGYLDVKDGLIVDAYEAKDIPREKMVVLCTGSQGEPLSALTRMANNEHKTLDIEKGDTVIVSASPVPGNEKAVARVKNLLAKIGVDFYDKERARVHVSGHGAAEELKLMLTMTKPKNFMPIHGEAMHLLAHAHLAQDVGISQKNIFMADNGSVLEMQNGKISYGESIDSGTILIEGLSVGDVDEAVLKDRKTLASQGFVSVVILVSKRRRAPLRDIEITMRGVSGGDDALLIEDATKIAQESLAHFEDEYSPDPGLIKREVRQAVSKFLWNRVRQRPMVIPVIVEV